MHSLKSEDLRSLVIRAVRAYENCRNGVFGENARDLFIELNNPPAFESLVPGMKANDKNFYDNPGVVLVPGGTIVSHSGLMASFSS